MAKDFSIALPEIIDKLNFVGYGLFTAEDFQKQERGAGSIIMGIADELETMNKGLYPKEEKETEE